MRLIHTTNLTLHEFFTENAPEEYAILSHCWGEDEVSFADFTNGRNHHGYGYQKISDCCALARSHGYEWAWVDTCCIDKTSSAELSEAINSMFTWYERSSVCYVFLPDYRSTRPGHDAEQKPDANVNYDLSRSRWFTRGWTLQELVAPGLVIFYDQDGVQFGDKARLAEQLCDITKIGVGYLIDNKRIQSASIARRMSWASQRTTTRKEDIAYCLLGIFNVNMPLLYGEGDKAFLRLQETILQQNADDSLFAWQSERTEGIEIPRGLLAFFPREFAESGDIISRPRGYSDPPCRLTNRGVELPMRRAPAFLRLVMSMLMPWDWIFTRSIELTCQRTSNQDPRVFITLQSYGQTNQYFRTNHAQLTVAKPPLIHWLLTNTHFLSGGWTNFYIGTWAHPKAGVPFTRGSYLLWRLRTESFLSLVGTFLFPALAALANWKYDNPMLVAAIILLGFVEHLKSNVRVVFALTLVVSGNLGIGPPLSATERSRG